MRDKRDVVLAPGGARDGFGRRQGLRRFDRVTYLDALPWGGTVQPMVTPRTGTGDDGTTDLLGQRRVSKASVAIDALGDLDEATSTIGVARAHLGDVDTEAASWLQDAQRDLYEAMSEVAIPVSRAGGSRIVGARVDWLTRTCEAIALVTPTPTQFVLPGTSVVGAQLDVARTVVRRAERTVVRMLEVAEADPALDLPTNRLLGAYLNRLSTLLFLLARRADLASGRAPDLARSAPLR
jgi:cob(I)alamin adenosyltransferase